jgi:hypothetical protein
MAKLPNDNAQLTRRGMLRTTGGIGLAAAAGSLMIPGLARAGDDNDQGGDGRAGDVAILRFLAAAELIETDFWEQYQNVVASNSRFSDALSTLDSDMPTYVNQNTADEQSHAAFLNGYLASIGAPMVDLSPFRTLAPPPGDTAPARITNLRNLTIDTSFWNRYVSSGNPDFGDTFGQVVNIVHRPAVPLATNLTDNQMLAVAYTAAFHFPSIEQGGTSLYTHMVGNASSANAVKIVASIGPSEMAHYMIWRDKVGNVTALDSGDGLVFPDLSSDPNHNQVMPKPCKLIHPSLPLCSAVRPTSRANAGAVAAATFLINSGLFTGQSNAFFASLMALARRADEAHREQ